MVLNSDCVVQKRWSCEVVGSHQFSECNPVLRCVWEALLFWFLIWHFMASGTFVKFEASHHAAVGLLVLNTILVLLIARTSLLKLKKQGARIVLPSCACHLARLSPDLYSKGGCDKNYNFGTRMLLNRDCEVQKRWSCEVVGGHQFFPGDPGLCWGSFACLIVDMTLYGQWHICQVRCQPHCNGSFACLGSHPSFANSTGAFAEVAKARCHNCSCKLCLPFGANELRSLEQRQLCKNRNFGTATS